MPLSPSPHALALRSLGACAFAVSLLLAGPSGAEAPPAIAPEPGGTAEARQTPDALGLPTREWALDPLHTAVSFSVSHLGFSRFTAGFDRVDATLTLDPEAPDAARLTATVDLASLDLPGSDPTFLETMLSPSWFDVATAAEMTFTSSAVQRTGPETATVDGTLSLRGAQAPLSLDVRFNGGYPSSPFEPNARIGFSARGTVSRTALGMGLGVPAPGSTFGVGDAVEILIEAEFIADPVAAE